MMSPRSARIEQVVFTGGHWRIYLATDQGEGQARTVLEYDREPSRGEIERDGKAWLKSLHSPPELFEITLGQGGEP